MPSDVPTVKVVDPADKDGYIVINRSEFDEKKHKLWQEPVGKKAAAGDPPAGGEGVDDKPKVKAPDPWVLRTHVKDSIASAMEAAGLATPSAIVSATEDALVNLKMGRQLAAKIKKAASAWLDEEAAYRASLN